jgi:hypothetical protein
MTGAVALAAQVEPDFELPACYKFVPQRLQVRWAKRSRRTA